ncbi:MAG: glycosyltransferase, partial [Kiritimatiellae bacterium]|nr:glycosyltransferase [Kiritimatiellia bacterium]
MLPLRHRPPRYRPPGVKFSIVTPNYNYGRFLKKNLRSVLDQVASAFRSEDTSRPDASPNDAGRAQRDPRNFQLEHIVVDGGSTDDSVSILKDWAAFAAAQPAAKAGRYSFSYVSEPDHGQTDAINKGLRRATGDIVAWL